MNSIFKAAVVVGIFGLGLYLYQQHSVTSQQDKIAAYRTITEGQMLLYGAIRNDFRTYTENYAWPNQKSDMPDFFTMNKNNLVAVSDLKIHSDGAIVMCYKGKGGKPATCLTVVPKVQPVGNDIQITFHCEKSNIDPEVLKNLFPDCLTHQDAITEPEWDKALMQRQSMSWGHWPGTINASAP